MVINHVGLAYHNLGSGIFILKIAAVNLFKLFAGPTKNIHNMKIISVELNFTNRFQFNEYCCPAYLNYDSWAIVVQ